MSTRIYLLSREELDALYGEGITQAQLAARFATSVGAVRARLRDLGIRTAPHGKRRWAQLSAEGLRDLYWRQGQDAGEIARQFGVTTGAVLNRMCDLQIPRRPRGCKNRADRERLAAWHALDALCLGRLYWQEDLSSRQIGERYSVSERTVLDRLAQWGIPRKSRRHDAQPPDWFWQSRRKAP